jgi:hypothetical protein
VNNAMQRFYDTAAVVSGVLVPLGAMAALITVLVATRGFLRGIGTVLTLWLEGKAREREIRKARRQEP